LIVHKQIASLFCHVFGCCRCCCWRWCGAVRLGIIRSMFHCLSTERLTCVCVLSADDVVNRAIRVSEQYTAVRLVSSGRSYNRVTVLCQRTVTAEDNDWKASLDHCTCCC